MARRRQANLDYRKQARRVRALGRLEHAIADLQPMRTHELVDPVIARMTTDAARLAAVIAKHQGYTP